MSTVLALSGVILVLMLWNTGRLKALLKAAGGSLSLSGS